jgi:hypothetical protein
MPTVVMRKESSRENGDLISRLCRQIFSLQNRRNFDERPKVLAPTVHLNRNQEAVLKNQNTLRFNNPLSN